jgi:hypothetical protein
VPSPARGGLSIIVLRYPPRVSSTSTPKGCPHTSRPEFVGYGERLCFEGAPLIVPPLAQDLAKRVPEAFEGEAIDPGRATAD